MGVASVSEYVASLTEEQRRPINAFIEFMVSVKRNGA